jgi:hypothetical protein
MVELRDHMDATLRSRWSDAPRLDDEGKVVPVIFGARDLEICKLLTPYAREPWGYQYLPTSYIAALDGRSYNAVRARLSRIHKKPYAYIKLPDQPKNNYRDRIFSIAPNGLSEIKEAGIDVPKFKHRVLPHELMACITAASFEYGARKHKLDISFPRQPKEDFYPDFPGVFTMGGWDIWKEDDTGSETISHSADPDATTIGAKFDNYLKLIHARRFKKSVAVFITTRETRMNSMIAVLKKSIDKKRYDHEYADHFLFTHIIYDRFLNKLPPLTDWAVKTKYARAGTEPFSFIK